jgi:hypothetical protein
MANVAKGQLEKSFDTLRLPAPLYPSVTDGRIKIKQTFLASFDIAAQATGPSFRGFSLADLMGQVPGGLTYWNAARIEKVTCFLKPDSTVARIEEMQITVPNVAGDTVTGPTTEVMPMTFRSEATDGNSLPTVSWRYGLAYRMRWRNVSNPTNIFTVTLPSTAGEANVTHRVVVQFTLELVSPTV